MSRQNPPGGAIRLAGKRVSRVGLGTMRLTGAGTWGPPRDADAAIRVLREAVGVHGISHIDTADSYGPHTVEELIRRALRPYPPHLLIATKVGMVRPGPDRWVPLGRPEYLRAAVEASLRRLATGRLELCYLHRIDPMVPLTEQVGELGLLQQEGKIGHIGLSKVAVEQIRAASAEIQVAAVQNVLNRDEPDDPAVDYCRVQKIPYVPYRPLNAGALASPATGPGEAVRWLLSQGDHIAPIPGTSAPDHLRDLVESLRPFALHG
ncbi:aldo/keto reductase [Streptomyces sp. So13.3]|uniref:aldo/keto reductase n=1 Tax=unclassified Streptomyces TaxID=2593676 RepID=UPI001105AD74|nr:MULTISPECIES: aldo/keto reductase [unclassified Streptomyces]NEA75412.1 aldo/keto reductase [Streptomyces sp. SID13588]QNA73157.1 aldo/keto reductase [Streptomyces sp. So13.3]